MDETRDWITRKEAAVRLGKTVRTIDNWIRSGHLTAYRFGPREVRIPLDQFVTEQIKPDRPKSAE